MISSLAIDRATGVVLLALTVAVTAAEWGLTGRSGLATTGLALIATALLSLRVRNTRRAFVAVALGLTVALALRDADWMDSVRCGLGSAAFIAAFFIALATMRSAAESAASMARAGRYLAQQPPGRRYLALTVGGQLFALLLNYGSIALLGTLATSSARTEPNPEIRFHRTRRMLLAIQRGFLSSLPWSPMSFAMAITIALVPGTSWAQVAPAGMITAFLLAASGWALDTLFKPRLSAPPPPRARIEGGIGDLKPLFVLLALLFMTVVTLHVASGVRVVGVVLLVIPIMAIIWIALLSRQDPALPRLGPRLTTFVLEEMPGFRGELVLLMMAGYIGAVGAPLLVPLVTGLGIDTSSVAPGVLLVACVWIMPVLGQLGMNPILAASLLVPLLPTAETMGVTPQAVVVAVTAGWALSGASSPFTATTILIGSFAGKTPLHVGLRWNGGFSLACGALLSVWVWLYAFVF